MEEFLCRTKEVLKNLDSVNEVHVVLGNESCDLDSAVAALVYAFFLHKTHGSSIYLPLLNISQSQYRLRTEITYLLGTRGISADLLTFRDQVNLDDLKQKGKLKLHLVDHNVLSGKDKSLDECVVSVIDHHVLERAKDDRVSVTLEMVGSCCTLVAEVLTQHKQFDMSSDLALLLYATILIDTVNLSEKAGKTTPKDLSILEVLKSKMVDVDGDELFNEIQEAKLDVSGLTCCDLLEKDMKMVRGTAATVTISSIPVAVMELCGRTDFKTDMEAFRQSHSADVAMVMSFLDKGQGQLVRELAFYSPDTALIAKLTDFMCSSNDPDLGLELMEEVKAMTCYSQRNVKASRKKVLPLVTIYLNKPAGNSEDKSTGNSHQGEAPVSNALVDDQISMDPLVSLTTSDQTSMDPLVSLTTSDQTSMDPLVSLTTSDQTSMDPLVSLTTSGQTSMDPLVSLTTSDQTSMDPLVSLTTSGQTSMDPLISLTTSGQSTMDPLISLSQSGQVSMDPLVSLSDSDQSSIDPLVNLSTSGQSSMDPLVNLTTSGQSSFDPLVNLSTNGQSSFDPLISISPSGQSTIDPLVNKSSSSQSSLDPLVILSPKSQSQMTTGQMSQGLDNSVDTLGDLTEADIMEMPRTPDICISGASRCSGNSSEHTSAPGSRFSSYPVTPPNSMMDGSGFNIGRGEHILPSFNSSEMVRRIQEKKDLLSGSTSHSGSEGNSVPYTPQNSFVDNSFLKEHSLPSFNNSDMIQRIQQKRSSMEYGEINIAGGGTGSNLGEFVPFTPQNSYVEGHMDRFLGHSIDAQQLTSQLTNVKVLNDKSVHGKSSNSATMSPVFLDNLSFPVSSSADNSSTNTADHTEKSHDLLSCDLLADVSYDAKNKPLNMVAAGIAMEMVKDETSDLLNLGEVSHREDDDEGDQNSRGQGHGSPDDQGHSQGHAQPDAEDCGGPKDSAGHTSPKEEEENVDSFSSHLIMSQDQSVSSKSLSDEKLLDIDQLESSKHFPDPEVNVDIVTEFASSFVNQILDNALSIVTSPPTGTLEPRDEVTSPFTPFTEENKPGSFPYLLSPVEDSSTTESSDASSTTTEGSYRILSPDNLTAEDTARVTSPDELTGGAMAFESEVYIPSNNYDLKNLAETIIEEELEEENDQGLSSVSNKEIIPSELPPLQSHEEIIPSELPTLKSHEEIIPSELPPLQSHEEIIPSELPTLQSHEEIIPSELPPLQSHEEIIPSELPTLKSHEEIIPSELPPLQSHEEIIPSELPTLQSHEEIIPSELPTLQSHEEIIPSELPPLQSHEEIIQSELPPLQSHEETIPSELPPLQSHEEIIPSELPPLQSHEEIIPSELLPLQSHEEIIPSELPPLQSHEEIIPSELPPLQSHEENIPSELPPLQSHEEIIPNELPPLQSHEETIPSELTPLQSHEKTIPSELPPLQETEVILQYKQEEDVSGSISNESLTSSSGAKSDVQNGCDTDQVVKGGNSCDVHIKGDNSTQSHDKAELSLQTDINVVPGIVNGLKENVPKSFETEENLESAIITSDDKKVQDTSETSNIINISQDSVKTRKNSNNEKKKEKHVKSSKSATKKTHMNAKDKLRGIEFTEEWQDDDIPGMPPTEEDEESLSDESSGSRSRHSSDSSAGDDIPVRPSSIKTKIAANMNILTEDGLDEGLGPDSIEVLGELEWENDTPVKSPAEPIPQYTAEDESRDAKHWRGVEISGQQHKIDLKVIEPYKKVLSHGGYYGDGLNAIIVFSGCYLPDKSRKDYQYVMDNLFLYVVSTLELLVAEDYMIVYFHGATPRRQMPSFGWLRKCYQMIDRRLRKNLKGLLLVHPTLWLKTIVVMTKPFISAKFTSKLRFVRTLQELSHLVPVEYIYIPDQVKIYDSNLSQHLAPQTTSVTPAPPVSAL